MTDRSLTSLRLEFNRDQEMHRAAAASLAVLFEAAYPPDKSIAWTIGGNRKSVYRGHVIRHCFGMRVEVRNDRTGKARFIYASDVVPVRQIDP